MPGYRFVKCCPTPDLRYCYLRYTFEHPIVLFIPNKGRNRTWSEDGGVIEPCSASFKNTDSKSWVLGEASSDSEACCATSDDEVVE